MAKNILIAEDNDSNFMLVNAILKNEGVITRAIHGLDVVEKAKTGSYDIIFMDIRMPYMDGLEATKEIRTFNTVIPIVALTANAFDSDRVNALSIGCNDFLSKPIKKSELIDMLRKY